MLERILNGGRQKRSQQFAQVRTGCGGREAGRRSVQIGRMDSAFDENEMALFIGLHCGLFF